MMTEQEKEPHFPIHLTTTIPAWLHHQLMKATTDRYFRLIRENHPKRNKVVSHAEERRALRQVWQEAVQEALEDWLAKDKGEKWQ
jgi:hypothetical protein